MEVSEASRIARGITGWLSCACYDMAGSELGADEMFDDVDVLCDVLGDRIIDVARGCRDDYEMILEHLVKVTWASSVKKAAIRLLGVRS